MADEPTVTDLIADPDHPIGASEHQDRHSPTPAPLDLDEVRKRAEQIENSHMSDSFVRMVAKDAVRLVEEVERLRKGMTEAQDCINHLNLITGQCAQAPCTERLFGKCGKCVACRARIFEELKAALESERAISAGLRGDHRRVTDLVNSQAEDDGLWFIAQTAPEDYLQRELRRLHAVCESRDAPDPK